MGTLPLNFFSIRPKKFVKTRDEPAQCLLMIRKKKSVLCCSGGNCNAINSNGLSSGLTEKLTTPNADHVAPLNDEGIISVLSPIGKNQAESAVKDWVPCSGIGIVKFFSRKKFLITGATGFLAKVLIEKILRTVPDVDRIYLIIKAKNKEAATERLKHEIINTELFKCLQQTYGKSYEAFMLSKLVPVVGNVCKDNLGLEEDVADAIAKEVDVIVNSAANTTFDERYDVALDINTKGPSRLMSFAKNCKKIKLFLHVSTVFVNGEREGRIMENPLCIGDSIAEESLVFKTEQKSTSAVDVEDEMKLVLDSKKALEDNAVAPKMKELGMERANKYGWQNTYVFTKAMGEMLIDDVRGEIPLVIVRPSVIESTYREPFPGWIEGNRMIDPLIRLYGKGLLSGFPAEPNSVFDVVPADLVVNAILAAIAKHGAAGKSESSTVYQVASSVVNPLVNESLFQLVYEHFNSMPCLDSMGRPIHVPELKFFSSMEDFSSHLWTEAIQRSKLMALANRNGKESPRPGNIGRIATERAKYLTYLANIYQAYTSYGGRFDSCNTQRLMQCMCQEERKKFGFDIGSIDWTDYISNVHIPGVRKHVMKESRDV